MQGRRIIYNVEWVGAGGGLNAIIKITALGRNHMHYITSTRIQLCRIHVQLSQHMPVIYYTCNKYKY